MLRSVLIVGYDGPVVKKIMRGMARDTNLRGKQFHLIVVKDTAGWTMKIHFAKQFGIEYHIENIGADTLEEQYEAYASVGVYMVHLNRQKLPYPYWCPRMENDKLVWDQIGD